MRLRLSGYCEYAAMANYVADEGVVMNGIFSRDRWFKTLDRIRACGNTAFGGRYSKYLKASPVLTPEDLEFLKDARQI